MMATGAGVTAAGQVLEKPALQQKPPVTIEVDGMRVTMDDLLSGRTKTPRRLVAWKIGSDVLRKALAEHLEARRPSIVKQVMLKRATGPIQAGGVTFVLSGLGMMVLVAESDDPRLTGRTSKEVLFKPDDPNEAPRRPGSGAKPD